MIFLKLSVHPIVTSLLAAAFALGNCTYAVNFSEYLITPISAGKIRIGMTVAEAQIAMPGFSFKRTSDGEGVALIEVKSGNETHLIVYASEDDVDKPVDPEAKIELIEVISKRYKTKQGIFPTMSVIAAEKILGEVKEIMTSEIESREYAKFKNQPRNIAFRLLDPEGMAGIYAKGERKTKKYSKDAYVFSIIITAFGVSDGSRAAEVGEYNKMISEAASKNEAWVKSPMQVVFKLAGEFEEMKSRSIEIKAPFADGSDTLFVTITDEGLLDDSVRGVKVVLELSKNASGIWRVVSLKRLWRCWDGRGHTDFSPALCS